MQESHGGLHPRIAPRSDCRSRLVVGVAVLTLAGCTPGGNPTVDDTPDTEAVVQSRDVLGDPMLALAEAVIDVEEGIDDARHRVPRGVDMQRRLETVRQDIDAVLEAAETAEQAADEAAVAEAAEIVDHAAAAARDAVEDMRAEAEFLADIAAIDRTLLDAAESWDERGSQSEIRARLARVADELGGVRARARDLEPAPAACRVMKQNRRRWARTVRRRTLNLAGQATSAGGAEFDRLRAAYRALPVAEEPRVADRRDRTCWEHESQVVAVAETMRTAVDRLRSSLSG